MSSPTESEVLITKWKDEFTDIKNATRLARYLFDLFHDNANIYDYCLLRLFCFVHELEEDDVIRPVPAVPSFKEWYVDTLVTKEQPIGEAVLKLRDIIKAIESIDVTTKREDPSPDADQI